MGRILYFILAAGLGLEAHGQEALSGRVTDPTGAPLPGVEVRILAGSWSDTTDADGRYALQPTVAIHPNPRFSPGSPATPGLRLRPLPGDNLDLSLRDLNGRRPASGSRLAPGAWASAASAAKADPGRAHPAPSPEPAAGRDSRLSPATDAPASKRAAAPAIWVQAYKSGYAVAAKQVPSNAGSADFVLTPSTAPDFGPNVLIYDPTMPMAAIQSQLDTVFNRQVKAQFGTDRYAVLFQPGIYNLNVDVGYYTQVLGLGATPDEVDIRGSVRSQAGTGTGGTNVTIQFWRSVENLSITPTNASKSVTWAVSQAAPFRRNLVRGGLNLSIGGWASGGYLADTRVDGTVQSGSQQQWFSRNTQWAAWSGGVWNMFFLGVNAPPAGTWPTQPYTVIPETPVLREKPFLRRSESGGWTVFLPALRKNLKGTSWNAPASASAGTALPLDRFHIARPVPGNAAVLNAALAAGKHLLLTPGLYFLDEPLKAVAPGTVILGLGMATLVPVNGTAALELADEDGMTVSGIVVDAGPEESPALLRIGPAGSSKGHEADPTVLHDVFLRVGGPREGSASVTVEVNSANAILDHFWVWRADHGTGARWELNRAANGLIVRGKDVTAYGLFVEHYQEYQTLWEGEGGRTYFYQCELPYDPPSQDAWQHDGTKGFAGYKVAPTVKTHAAHGLGVYSAIKQPVQCDHAIEAPETPGVSIKHAVAIWLNGAEGSGINNVLNTSGGAVTKTKTKATID